MKNLMCLLYDYLLHACDPHFVLQILSIVNTNNQPNGQKK